MRDELAIFGLWLLAVVPTFLLVHDTGMFAYLGPLYFLCMLGSVYIVRNAKRRNR